MVWCLNKYLVQHPFPAWIDYIGAVHGWLFLAYAFFSVKLSIESRWSVKTTLLLLLAGTIPIGSFIAEHRVVMWDQARSPHPRGLMTPPDEESAGQKNVRGQP